MPTCLDGHVMSNEFARFVRNILSVDRVRPLGEEEDNSPDDAVNDEEIMLTSVG